MPIHNFDKVLQTNSMSYLVVGWNERTEIEPPEEALKRWDEIYNEYCKRTANNEALNFYSTSAEIGYLEMRYTAIYTLVANLCEQYKEEIGRALNKWKIPFNIKGKIKPQIKLLERHLRIAKQNIDLKNRKVTPKTINHKGRDIYPDRIELFGDNLYLLDKASGNIFGLNKQVEIMKSFQCENCTGGFVDFKLKNGKLWALEQSIMAVFVFSLDGRLESKIQLDSSEINFPRSLAIDDNNLFYVLDRHQGTIVVFDSQGNYKYNFLAAGGARGQIYYPVELKFDPWGQLCVVEEGNGRVQIFSHK